MLGFFRKYQKFFFVIVTVIIVISFTFFGTFSSFGTDSSPADKSVAKAVDGSDIMQNEMLALIRLLDGGHEILNSSPNILNDGVIYKDFLLTHAAQKLTQKYFDLLKPDLQERLDRAKSFQVYGPALALWNQMTPHMSAELKALKEQTLSPEVFGTLSSLYVSQAQFPPDLVKRFLVYQAQQSGNKPDPFLQKGDLSLFGYHTVEQWFGKKFMQLAAQTILNGAIIAEQKGIKVSNEEARKDLYQNAAIAVQRLASKEELATLNLGQVVQYQIHSLGLNEATAVKLWRKVMLFRNLVKGESENLDSAIYTTEAALVESYELPSHLRLRDFRSLAKLQVYLDAVTKTKNALLLSNTYLTADEIERKVPELVQRKFLVEFTEAKKDEGSARIALKELWDWELKEENFEVLSREFSVLSHTAPKSKEERYSALEKLSEKQRQDVDKLARKKIVDQHPEWLIEALSTATPRKETISLRGKGSILPFQGLEDSKELLPLLLKESKIDLFTADNNYYYNITVLEKPTNKEVLTFVEALEDGTLDQLLDRRLDDGDNGQKLFADLLKAISDDFAKTEKKSAPNTLDFYVHNRLFAYMREAQKNLEIKDAHEPTTLENQWRLVKREKEVMQNNADGFEDYFTLNEGSVSKVHVNQDLSFAKILKRYSKEDMALKTSLEQKAAAEVREASLSKLINEINIHLYEFDNASS